MLSNNQTYTNLQGTEISIAGVPAVVKSSEKISEDFKDKRFISAVLIAVSLSVSTLQTGFVLNANATGNPISAPISAPTTIQCPIGKVSKVVDSTIICVPLATPQPTHNGGTVINLIVNPITSPETSPIPVGTSSSSSSSPITAPEVSPSPSSAPITAPEVSPSPSSAPITAPEVSPTPTPTPSSQPSDNDSGHNGGGSSNNSGGSSAPSCNNEAPKAPKIISAISAGKNEITLNWEKAAGNVTHYAISYGFMKGKPLYGNTNIGNVNSYTVKGLSAGVTYYFAVNAVNGCIAGPVSNEIGIKGGGKFINTPAVGFKSAVLGKVANNVVQFRKDNNNPVVKVDESPKPVNIKFEAGNSLNPGLLGKAVSFFKGLFN